MGFLKGGEHPLRDSLIGGEVNTPPVERLPLLCRRTGFGHKIFAAL